MKKGKIIKPIVIKPPKKRIPQAPPAVTHRDRKDERERVPSGRLDKHRKPAQEE